MLCKKGHLAIIEGVFRGLRMNEDIVNKLISDTDRLSVPVLYISLGRYGNYICSIQDHIRKCTGKNYSNFYIKCVNPTFLDCKIEIHKMLAIHDYFLLVIDCFQIIGRGRLTTMKEMAGFIHWLKKITKQTDISTIILFTREDKMRVRFKNSRNSEIRDLLHEISDEILDVDCIITQFLNY